MRAFTTWLDAVDAWQYQRAEASEAVRYFALRMELDQAGYEDMESEVSAVLAAASGFLNHSPVLPVQQSLAADESVDSFAPLVQEFVGVDVAIGRRSISPPGSSPGEADDYHDPALDSSVRRRAVRPIHVARTSSRRVALDDAVGANALVEGVHVVCVAKKSTKGGFGICISDDLQITSCAAGSPAETAGLQVGCTIIKVNDCAISSREDFKRQIKVVRPGDTVAFTCTNIVTGKARAHARVGRRSR